MAMLHYQIACLLFGSLFHNVSPHFYLVIQLSFWCLTVRQYIFIAVLLDTAASVSFTQ